jgi:hypothetical protein
MRAAAWALLFAALLVPRLAHLKILWVEESYPAAAAIQILHGKQIYRDFFFDKPPLAAYLYVLWGARDGWPLRVAGALYVLLACFAVYWLARALWGDAEGAVAAGLLAVFLTFGVPSAVLALAPDLLMVAPHLLAVYFAIRGRAFTAGLAAGVATLAHTKGLLVLAACLLWQWRAGAQLLAGFALPNFAAVVWLGWTGSFGAYWHQVWLWGAAYARDTFVENPLREGLLRTANWAGFHAAAAGGALYYLTFKRDSQTLKLALWILLALAGVAGGLRFFPRYYFLLLPPVATAGARGLMLAPLRLRLALLALLLAPVARFGPRYAVLGSDLILHREHEWADLAMNQDSRAVAGILLGHGTIDSILIWGYRPDIIVYTRAPVEGGYLDSQPLTGVLADRHLVSSKATFPDLAAANRRKLVAAGPEFLIDGLGPYNPKLAITEYPELRNWLSGYELAARTPGSVIYRRHSAAAPAGNALFEER